MQSSSHLLYQMVDGPCKEQKGEVGEEWKKNQTVIKKRELVDIDRRWSRAAWLKPVIG